MHHINKRMLASSPSFTSSWAPPPGGNSNQSSIVDVFQSILSCTFNDDAVAEATSVTTAPPPGDDSGDCSHIIPCGPKTSSALPLHHTLQQQQYGDTNDPSVVDAYAMLQIRVDAIPSEIRESYRKLALWHHPGRSIHHHEIPQEEKEYRENVFQLLAACYETLMDSDTRRRYNYIVKVEAKKAARRIKKRNKQALSFLQNDWRVRTRKKVVPLVLADESLVDYSSDDTSSSSSSTNTTNTTSTSDYSFSTPPQLKNNTQQNPFGGPLSRLIKARNYHPFTDPYLVFRKVFETDLFEDAMKTKTTTTTITSSSSPPSLLYQPETSLTTITTPSSASSVSTTSTINSLMVNHNNIRKWSTHVSCLPRTPTKSASTLPPSTSSPPRSAAWTGSRTVEQDGSIVSITTRIRSNRKLTRTERTTTDPITGKKHTTISVHSEDIDSKFTNMSVSEPPHKCCGMSSTTTSAADDGFFGCCAPLLCL